MERHLVWREEYRARRYMDHLTASELDQRARDVFTNFTRLTEDGKVGPLPPSEGGTQWMILWTHVLEEFVLRYGPAPAGFSGFVAGLKFPDPRLRAAPKAAKAVRERKVRPGTYLVKYGKQQHLIPLLQRGALRLAPASSYADPSLNTAVRDTELEFSLQPNPREIKLEVFSGKTGQPKGPLALADNIITKKLPTDYDVYCLSLELAPRMFLDFEADSCLLITDPRSFAEKLFDGTSRILCGWMCDARPVTYHDPLNSRAWDVRMCFSKHFRYAYQKEYRVAWLPQEDRDKLAPIELKLGSLEGCAELVLLEEDG